MVYCATRFSYKTVQDCHIQADVYQLSDGGQRPAILWIHGGALIFGDRRMLRTEQAEQYLAQMGDDVAGAD